MPTIATVDVADNVVDQVMAITIKSKIKDHVIGMSLLKDAGSENKRPKKKLNSKNAKPFDKTKPKRKK